MTVNTIGSVAGFVTNGVTTNFPFYFKFLANEDLVVTYVNPLGVSSILTLGTHYTANGAGNDQGGSVVTTSALAGPGQLIVSREMEAFQQTSLRNQGKFLAETHEDVFDKLTMLIQQGLSIFARALKRPFGRDYFFAENRRITAVKDPVDDQDAATKLWAQRYVADLIASGTGPINIANNVLYVTPGGVTKTVQGMSGADGGSFIGFDWESPAEPNSLAQALRRSRNIRMYGAIVEDLTTNNLATFQAAALSGPGIIDARGLNCFLEGQVSIGEGQIWLLEGSTIRLGTYTGTTFWIYHAHESAIIGPMSIYGTGKAAGAQKAVEVNSSKRFLLYGITAFDMPGWGFYLSGNVGVSRSEGGRVINCGGHRCYKGYEDLPGSEYMTIDNPHFTQNAEFGMKTTAGNVRIINPQVLDNDKDGLLVFGGINHAHGGVVGGNINHNPQYNLHVSDVINGMSFTGTNFYANNGAGQGAIFLERTKGVNISDGIIDCRVYVFNAVGQNVLRDMYCPGDYGPMVLADESDKQPALLWVHNCTGTGIRRNLKNINNPGPMYTNVSRTGAVQALTVNVGTVIKFATVNRDDHAAYNVSTGVFTVPATQQGLYRIRACIVVTAPGYSPQSCYVELRIGATPVVLCASPAGFSTNVLTYNIDYEVELNAANTLSLVATISASSANFGHATYDSRLTIERIG